MTAVKADPDDPSAPTISALLAAPEQGDEDEDDAPMVAMDEADFPDAEPLFALEEPEDRKPFDLGAGGGLGGNFGGGQMDEDEKLFKPALELTYNGLSPFRFPFRVHPLCSR